MCVQVSYDCMTGTPEECGAKRDKAQKLQSTIRICDVKLRMDGKESLYALRLWIISYVVSQRIIGGWITPTVYRGVDLELNDQVTIILGKQSAH